MPDITTKSPSKPSPYKARIIVKFRDSVTLPYAPHAEKHLEALKIGPWTDLAKRFQGIELHPLFVFLSRDRLDTLVKLAKRNKPTYHPPNFFSYFVIPVPDGVRPRELAAALTDRKQWPAIAFAYVEGRPETLPSSGYLNPARTGIHAQAAWNALDVQDALAEEDGPRVTLIDIEQGWDFDDPSLPQSATPRLIHGCNMTHALNHGTSVLSLIVGTGGEHVRGIADRADFRTASIVRESVPGSGIRDVDSVHDALQAALEYLMAHGALGDVILLEVQSEQFHLPAEIEEFLDGAYPGATFELIEVVTLAGYVVVEAAGNGGQINQPAGIFGEDPEKGVNVDPYLYDPNNPSVPRDSGAIMVSGALPDDDHAWQDDTNYGKRIDCYAWGRGITAARSTDFGGTSGASAIVAGVVLLVQMLAKKHHNGRCYHPEQLREILKHQATQSNISPDKIKGMPNLGALVAHIQASPPREVV